MSDLLAWCDKVDELCNREDGMSTMLGGDAVPLIVAIIRAAERRRAAHEHSRRNMTIENHDAWTGAVLDEDTALAALADHLTREAGRDA